MVGEYKNKYTDGIYFYCDLSIKDNDGSELMICMGVIFENNPSNDDLYQRANLISELNLQSSIDKIVIL